MGRKAGGKAVPLRGNPPAGRDWLEGQKVSATSQGTHTIRRLVDRKNELPGSAEYAFVLRQFRGLWLSREEGILED
jgi:hypothetical protein